MPHIQVTESPYGISFSVQGASNAIAEDIVASSYYARLRELRAEEEESLQALLQLGTEWLDVEHGHLARIDVADGTHTIVATSGPHPVVSHGDTRDLSTTYCRTVIVENAVLAVRNAPDEGWAGDPAYETFGFSTYLGAKVVVDGEFYGTLCFADRTARDHPFTEEDAAAMHLLAETAGQLLRERPSEQSTPSETQLEALFEHSPNMINLHDEEGTLSAPNPRLCEKTGYRKDELTGMKVWELDEEATPETVQGLWSEMQPGDRRRWKGTYQCKDGSTFPVEVDLQCIEGEGENRFVVTSRDITERKEAERKLQETKQLLAKTLESLEEAVVVVDPSTRQIITCNAAVEKIFGYEKDELIGESTETLHKSHEAYEEFGTISESVLEGQGIFRSEYQMRRKDGQIIDTEHVVTPLEDENWPEGVVSVIRDVTERRRREQELEQMRERIELTLEHTDSVIFEIDLDTDNVWRHGSFEEFFNLPSDDVPTWKDHLDRAVHPDDREAFRRFHEQLADGEQDVGTLEYRTNPELGNVRWIRDSVYVEENGSRRLLGLAQDITDRKETAQQLQEERDLLGRILETSPVAIVMLNTEGEFVEASGRAENVLGLERDEVTSRTYNDPAWRIRGPDGGPMPDEELPFARVMATEEPVYDIEHMIEWPDGTQRLLSVSGAPLYDAEGEMEGAVFHLDDITEQRATRQALQEERDRFATLFHNFPTPVVHGRPTDEGRIQIQTVNERFETIFGYDEQNVRGEDLQDLIVPEDERDGASSLRRRLLAGETIDREVRRRAADGLRDFRVQVALREDYDGPTEGFAIYTDVTERNERERILAQRKALLEAQAEATIDGLLVVNPDRQVAFYNDRFLEVWGLPQTVFDESPPGSSDEQVLLDAVRALLPDPEAFREKIEYLYDHPGQESRDVLRLTDGRWLDRYSAPIVGSDETHFGRLWIFRDVTEQRQMMSRLLEVQEEERRRIDQEIHDEMGGLLTSIQFTVDMARRTAPAEASTEHFDQLESLVSDLSTVSRTISRKLYPSDLSDHGLGEALSSLLKEMENKRNLKTDLYSELEPEDRFSVLIERTVYWIVQESLLTIARRNDTDTAQIIVSKRGKRLYLHVFDEGGGLTTSGPSSNESFRLEAIRRRTEWLDGDVRIDAISDEGTRLSVTLPARLPFPTQ